MNMKHKFINNKRKAEEVNMHLTLITETWVEYRRKQMNYLVLIWVLATNFGMILQ